MDKLKEMVREAVAKHFPEATLEDTTITKESEVYNCIAVTIPGIEVKPLLHLNKLAEVILMGAKLGFTAEEIIEKGVMNAIDRDKLKSLQATAETASDWEQAKKLLFISVCNTEKHKDFLKEHVSKEAGDISIVARVMLGTVANEMGTAAVSKKIADAWNVTEEEILQQAIENSHNIMEPCLKQLSEYNSAKDMNEGEIATDTRIEEICRNYSPENGILILSNKIRNRGAAAMFYPGLLKKIAEELGSDMYIIPSSTDEVILIPENEAHDHKFMTAMLMLGNRDRRLVREEDVLSDIIRHYDRETDTIRLIID